MRETARFRCLEERVLAQRRNYDFDTGQRVQLPMDVFLHITGTSEE